MKTLDEDLPGLQSGAVSISGEPLTRKRLLWKGGWVLVWIAGAVACFARVRLDEQAILWIFPGILLCLFALCVPHHEHHYIDLDDREIVHKEWYGCRERSEERLPLENFSRIVVHHVCHPGGEGEDTFTGSVGLKPKTRGKILWVKSFAATKEEMSGEPNEFAAQLAARTGLPFTPHPDTL